MSIKALTWAFNLEMPSSGTKLTLLALANYANEEGIAYPSQKTLSKKTSLSARSIRTHLVTLEKLGLLAREPRVRKNGTYTSDLFKINVGAVVTVDKKQQEQISPVAEIAPDQRKISPNPAENLAYQDPSLYTTFNKDKPPSRQEEELFLLPCWVEQETWKNFVEMRRTIRKPLTPSAMKLIVESLQKMKADGENVNAVLEQSIMNSWPGVYPVKKPKKEKFDAVAYILRGEGQPRRASEKIIEHETERAEPRCQPITANQGEAWDLPF